MSAKNATEAPTTFWGIISNIGPGMILAGSIVGSGELIATTRRVRRHILIPLADHYWLIIKVFTQIELGRHAITNGKTSLLL